MAREARAARPGDPPPADTVVLDHEARHVRRRVLRSAGGEAILVDLPVAASLDHGDRLLLADGRQLGIVAADEPLAEVRAEGAALARLAWHVGNRHTPAQVEEGRLLIRRDHVLEDMLRRLGARICPVTEPFRPEGGAYGHGRTHAHAHGHDPHDDPNARILQADG